MNKQADGAQMTKIAIELMGSATALARATQTNVATVYRWKSGEIKLTGASLVAVLAIIKHPTEYSHHRRGSK